MKSRPFLGIAVMIAVQIVSGIASELSTSTALLAAIPIVGFFCAATCGGFVARRAFLLPALAVVFADLVLVAYALSYVVKDPVNFATVPLETWLSVAAMSGALLIAAGVGAWLGMRLALKRSLAKASPAT